MQTTLVPYSDFVFKPRFILLKPRRAVQTDDFLQFDLSRALHFSARVFDKLVIYHEIRSALFICNYMIVKE